MANYSKSVHSFRDVHQAFEQAGLKGSLLLEFNTHQEATTWSGRANAYRVLLRKQNAEAGREFACEFDHLMVRRNKGSCLVKIEPRGFNFVARTPEGDVVDFDKKTLGAAVPTPFEKSKAAIEAEDFLAEYEKEHKK
jgi:hypothetical protein